MARSHHRKKHKAHLRQFRHNNDITSTTSNAKTKASSVFSIAGALAGFAVSYFATQGSWAWVAGSTAVGAAAGYFIGKSIDS
jgi:hypothetical protein